MAYEYVRSWAERVWEWRDGGGVDGGGVWGWVEMGGRWGGGWGGVGGKLP